MRPAIERGARGAPPLRGLHGGNHEPRALPWAGLWTHLWCSKPVSWAMTVSPRAWVSWAAKAQAMRGRGYRDTAGGWVKKRPLPKASLPKTLSGLGEFDKAS